MSVKINPGSVATRLLALRESTPARAALRRANSVSMEHYAYPYLASTWSGNAWARIPLLRVAALAATLPEIRDDADVTPGQLLRNVALTGTDLDAASPKERAEERERALARIGTRLVMVQSGDLDKLHTIVRTILSGHRLEHPAVSWKQIVQLYLNWDLPDLSKRREVRRRLLEQFYTPPRRTDPIEDLDNQPVATT